MFKSPFSFDGRIRRTEYGITFIITTAFVLFLRSEIKNDDGMVLMAAIPLLWLLWAQGAKRCHDINKNGYWQLIPFYCVVLLFMDGKAGNNQYGEDPKERTVASAEIISAPAMAQAQASGEADENNTVIN